MNIALRTFRLLVANTKRKVETVYKMLISHKIEIIEWVKIVNQIILIIKFILSLIKH